MLDFCVLEVSLWQVSVLECGGGKYVRGWCVRGLCVGVTCVISVCVRCWCGQVWCVGG